MIPKEKANDLVNKFFEFDFNEFLSDEECAKQCALICVNEIIEELDFISELMTSNYDWHRNKYWQEVKQELEKI